MDTISSAQALPMPPEAPVITIVCLLCWRAIPATTLIERRHSGHYAPVDEQVSPGDESALSEARKCTASAISVIDPSLCRAPFIMARLRLVLQLPLAHCSRDHARRHGTILAPRNGPRRYATLAQSHERRFRQLIRLGRCVLPAKSGATDSMNPTQADRPGSRVFRASSSPCVRPSTY